MCPYLQAVVDRYQKGARSISETPRYLFVVSYGRYLRYDLPTSIVMVEKRFLRKQERAMWEDCFDFFQALQDLFTAIEKLLVDVDVEDERRYVFGQKWYQLISLHRSAKLQGTIYCSYLFSIADQ